MEVRAILKNTALPLLDTELLLAFLLNKSREFLFAHPEYDVSAAVVKKYHELEKKRLANWPVAYLVGEKGFYGLNFKVTPAVLTPRPETEMMVDDIISLAQKSSLKPLIIDLGTGSGAIIISVARELKAKFPALYRRSEFQAVDISSSALKVAKANALKYKLDKKITFHRGNLLSPLKLEKRDLSPTELIIAANLPYLTKTQIKAAPSISREPILALDGGKDGLKYYQELFKQLKGISFRNAVIICEIDPIQTTKIDAMASTLFPSAQFSVLPDLSGQNRFFMIKL